MKKLIITQNKKINYLLLSFFISSLCYSLNCYDTYIPSQFFNVSSSVTQGYTGEDQICDCDAPPGTYCDSYSIEAVSFPFIPKCTLNIGTPQEVAICSSSNHTQRPLILADNYDIMNHKWTEQGFDIYNKYNAPYNGIMSDPSTLISTRFKDGYYGGSFIYQPNFPHSVLKHKVFYADNSTGKVVDSSVFIFDHTRGIMKTYPFTPNNFPIGGVTYTHDITMNIKNNDCPTSTPYLNPLKAILGNEFGTSLAGYNYQTNIHEPNAPMHNYIIDKPIDLTIINSSEKIIYNPSEVDIDLNGTLTFPSGYTFKTVYGLYPTHAEVANADPNNLYAKPEDVPVISSYSSTYYVKSGSTLRIEPCVSLYDVEIIVETGGVVEYDENQIYGNGIITSNGGSIINNYVFPSTYDCFQECYDINAYDIDDYNVSSNETWSSDTSVAHTLTIESGNTLTINNGAKIEFGAWGKIIVERNASLVLEGCTLTNFCDNMWEGIDVWGDESLSQHSMNGVPSVQGKVIIRNSLIENSRTAISTGKKDTDGNQVAGFHGGIVQVENTTFRNNKRAVEFLKYQNINPYHPTILRNNISYFTSCVFETTDKLIDDNTVPEAFVTMWGVDGIRFLDCEFINRVPSLFNFEDRGAGIYTIDAGFIVGGCMQQLQYGIPCTNVGWNTFENLAEGIWASSTNGSEFVRIQQNHFINNRHAVIMEGMHNSMINRNNFNIPDPSHIGYFGINNWPAYMTIEINDYDIPLGIYMRESTFFQIDENNFSGNQINNVIPPNSHASIGIIINNSAKYTYYTNNFPYVSYGYGLAYNNTFQNTDIGLQAENDNIGQNNNIMNNNDPISEGLKFDCNNFDLLNYSVYVTGTPGQTGLLRNQGYCNPNNILEKPAANIFSPNNSDNHIYSHHNYFFNYYAYDDRMPIVNTNINNNIAVVYSCGLNAPIDACLSSFSIPKTKNNLLVDMNIKSNNIQNMVNNYNSLVDGGRRNDMLHCISTAPDQEISDTLSEYSPYLSDEVLLSMLDKLPHFCPVSMEDILIQNSPLTQEVLDIVLQHTNCCPASTINNIILAQNGVSSRKELEWLIDESLFEFNVTRNNLIGMYLDSLDIDSVIWVLEQDSSLQTKRQLIPFYIKTGNYTEAQNCINQIMNTQEGTMDDNLQLKQWQLDLFANGYNIKDLSEENKEVIESIVSSSLDLNMQAKVWYKMLTNTGYVRSPYPLESANSSERKASPEILKENDLFDIHPNPTSDNIVISWNQEIDGEMQIQVFDVFGKIVLDKKEKLLEGKQNYTLKIAYLKAGVYFTKLASNNNTQVKQFIKSR